MGKNARGRQTRTMNEMNALAQEQFDYFKEQQGIQKGIVDVQREQYEACDFDNPFADAQNPFANVQTDFRNIYGGAKNVYA